MLTDNPTESCLRCGRPLANASDWEVIDHQEVCEDCLTPGERRVIDDDGFDFLERMRNYLHRSRGGDASGDEVREDRLRRMAQRQGRELIQSESIGLIDSRTKKHVYVINNWWDGNRDLLGHVQAFLFGREQGRP